MTDRRNIAREISEIEQSLKDLEIAYEQYFIGVEKREPMQAREQVARRLRQFANRRIVQTDLRFRYQSLATRFHSYCGYWDRILRLMDEGRYVRQRPAARQQATAGPVRRSSSGGNEEADRLYAQLREASRTHEVENSLPDRDKIGQFLDRQRDKIRKTFGEKAVEFNVVIEGGKARIKVRAKK